MRGKDFRARPKDCPPGRVPDNVMLMDTPDEMLATAAAQGDRAAFATLVGRHYDRIHGLAWRLTGAKAEAEDLTQDICAALPAKLRKELGLKPDDVLIAETTAEGLLLRPAVTLPVELYSAEREQEFEAAEAELERALKKRAPR